MSKSAGCCSHTALNYSFPPLSTSGDFPVIEPSMEAGYVSPIRIPELGNIDRSHVTIDLLYLSDNSRPYDHVPPIEYS